MRRLRELGSQQQREHQNQQQPQQRYQQFQPQHSYQFPQTQQFQPYPPQPQQGLHGIDGWYEQYISKQCQLDNQQYRIMQLQQRMERNYQMQHRLMGLSQLTQELHDTRALQQYYSDHYPSMRWQQVSSQDHQQELVSYNENTFIPCNLFYQT
jgi:hypothetical protein